MTDGKNFPIEKKKKPNVINKFLKLFDQLTTKMHIFEWTSMFPLRRVQCPHQRVRETPNKGQKRSKGQRHNRQTDTDMNITTEF